MFAAVQNYIPLVTSEAGLCLTTENWQAAKVDAVSYSLEFLLYKPGLALLQNIPDLPAYLGWPGAIILNASALKANREGVYCLKSPYDGSKIKLTALQLIELLQHLRPDAVILPVNILQDCPQLWELWRVPILPFFNTDDLQSQTVPHPHGAYFQYAHDLPLEQWAHIPRYVMGSINPDAIRHLRAMGLQYIESDVPADAAFHGTVYSQTGEVDLTRSSTRMEFETIDTACTCPVCAQQLTKAYFHHLLQHTPLLCQRFLIQHNVFWMANP